MSSNAINAGAVQNLNFDFLRDIAPVAGIARPAGHGREPVVSGQDRSRIHRLRQGQSGQDQIGVGRHRHAAICRRRAVQDDDRRRPWSTCPIGAAGGDHRLLGGQVQAMFGTMPASIGYIRAGKLRALAVTSATRRRSAGRAGHGRVRARLRGERLVRHRRAERHAAGDRRQLNNRSTPRLPTPRCASASPTSAAKPSPDAGRLRKIHRRRNREMGQGRQVRQYQGGLTAIHAV